MSISVRTTIISTDNVETKLSTYHPTNTLLTTVEIMAILLEKPKKLEGQSLFRADFEFTITRDEIPLGAEQNNGSSTELVHMYTDYAINHTMQARPGIDEINFSTTYICKPGDTEVNIWEEYAEFAIQLNAEALAMNKN